MGMYRSGPCIQKDARCSSHDRLWLARHAPAALAHGFNVLLQGVGVVHGRGHLGQGGMAAHVPQGRGVNAHAHLWVAPFARFSPKSTSVLAAEAGS